MITKVVSKNFRGFDININLERLNLLIGPNGSGKSAISGAIILTQLGFIPGHSKANADIFNAYAPGDDINIIGTGFHLDSGESFDRMFVKTESGQVSQKFLLSLLECAKKDFDAGMAKAPKVFDLHNFKQLSDQKKLDLIFKLYPPVGDPKKIANEIGMKEKEKNKVLDGIRKHKMLIANLTESKSKMNLPPGTLASIKTQIEELESQKESAQDQLATAKSEAKVQKALEESRAKGMQQKTIEDVKSTGVVANMPKIGGVEKDGFVPDRALSDHVVKAYTDTIADSLNKIIATMEKVGCEACAAMLVCKQELKKHKKMNDEVRF